MTRHDIHNEIDIEKKTYDGFTLKELIENIGYLHMTNQLKGVRNSGKYDENYHKTVKIYTEYPLKRKKIIEFLTDLEEKETRNDKTKNKIKLKK